MVRGGRAEPTPMATTPAKTILGLALLLVATGSLAEEELGEFGELGEEAGRYALEPPPTMSPRDTLRSFFSDGREAWRIYLDTSEPRRDRYQRATRRLLRASRVLDLSQLPPGSRGELGMEKTVLLLDVLERIRIPPWKEIPDAETVEAEGLGEWTIPRTSITIRRVEEGPRAGEFLFTAGTVERVEAFYERTRHLEPRDKAVVRDGYALIRTHPGWWIPLSWVKGLPRWARSDWLGQAAWQWIAFGLVLAISVTAVGAVHRWAVRQPRDDSARSHLSRMAVPASILLFAIVLNEVVLGQIGILAASANVVRLGASGAMVLAAAWIALLAGGAAGQSLISSRVNPLSVDAHLVRIAARLVSLVAAVLIVVEGARLLGLPVVGLVAGLGVGGLAVALAAQSTIENFIGSLTIFADRPVRVGDFCRFGDELGTVEQIGLRSTRIRTLGRSVMTIPNAEFSRLRLDNFSQRDRSLLRTTVSLRYETTPRQLRDALQGIRQVLLDHPRVLEDPARVRLIEFGPHAFQVEIFAYVDSSDWNEFLAIREEVFLQIGEAIEKAGTRLAVPAQTTYLARDPADEPTGADG